MKYRDGGVHDFRGKRTYFYNGGEILWDGVGTFGQPLVHNKEERQTWEVIIILPRVEIIPNHAFSDCSNVKIVIMSDTVRRIERCAFNGCCSLEFVKLSTNLEYIGYCAFYECKSLTSIFIPPSCREIGNKAFNWCYKLIILSVPQHTTLDADVIVGTALIRALPFETVRNHEEVNHWIKNQNMTQKFELHRACSSFNPTQEMVYRIVKCKGLNTFQMKNAIGITPLQYLEENPFAEIDQKKMVTQYVLEMMGEVV